MRNKRELLKRKIERYLRKGQLFENDEHIKLEKPFLRKSRKNFTVANLLFKISVWSMARFKISYKLAGFKFWKARIACIFWVSEVK